MSLLRRRVPQDSSVITHILVITLSNIGDVILTTPVVSALHHSYPDAQLTVLVGPGAAQLFEQSPWITAVIPYDKHASFAGKIRLIRCLRQKRFDLVVDLRHTLIPLFLHTPYRTALVRRKRREPLNMRTRHLQILRQVGCDGFTLSNTFPFFNQADEEQAKRILQKQRGALPESFIVIAPGARSHLKQWGVKHFAHVGTHVGQATQSAVVIVGDTTEQATAAALAAELNYPDVTNVCGQTTLKELAAVLSMSRLLITNDSAPMHLAHELSVPVVAIFGPTHHEKYGRVNARSRIARVSLTCSPCELAQCPYEHECMTQLTPTVVIKYCLELLYGHQLTPAA